MPPLERHLPHSIPPSRPNKTLNERNWRYQCPVRMQGSLNGLSLEAHWRSGPHPTWQTLRANRAPTHPPLHWVGCSTRSSAFLTPPPQTSSELSRSRHVGARFTLLCSTFNTLSMRCTVAGSVELMRGTTFLVKMGWTRSSSSEAINFNSRSKPSQNLLR